MVGICRPLYMYPSSEVLFFGGTSGAETQGTYKDQVCSAKSQPTTKSVRIRLEELWSIRYVFSKVKWYTCRIAGPMLSSFNVQP